MKEIGEHFEKNTNRLDAVSTKEWENALKKCHDHLTLRLSNKTKYGAHSSENLGFPAVDYYTEYAYDSIIYGHWEWKEEFDLGQQLIRIADSRISTIVDSFVRANEKNKKRVSEGKHPLTVALTPMDIESTFFSLEGSEPLDKEKVEIVEKRYELIENYVLTSDDERIKIFWESVKEGLSRSDVAAILEIEPKQLDKLKEKFMRQIRKIDPGKDG
ncbi:MAG: hypothetical protein AAGB24_06120 [Bacteroidota bacterium]